ncbi:MAG: protein-export chaperone SecB [Holosporaceae bacterium]|jgi:preprotein translocase subunit SecB|nr:protein-export chaperone SecB [Holosporaceae bacterium]
MAQESESQSLGIMAQYVKDLSFENLSSAAQPVSNDKQPQIDVQLKINISKGDQSDAFIVELITKIEAKLEKPLFILELNYCGEFIVNGFSQEMLDPILYIECPRLLFPFARSIIAHVVSEGGFPPIYLAPVNFAELYQQQLDSKNQTMQ